ncbi:MAG: hypothetical protein ACE5FZ_09170 [Nitrospiria bacterium]
MIRDRGQGTGDRRQGERETSSALLLLLFSFFLFSGCLGESNTDPPSLPPGVINVSNKPGVSSSPSAATSGGDLYMVWAEGDGAGNDGIFLARSNNGGLSFQTFQVSNTGNFSGNPKIALSSEGTNTNIHVVWEEFLPAKSETDIFYRRVVEDTTGNLTFEPTKNLSLSDPVCGPPARTLPCPSQVPAIATFNNHVFIAWMESTAYVPPDFNSPGSTFMLFNSDIIMVRSLNHGVDFLTANTEILSLPNTGFSNKQSPSQNPSLAAANGFLFIAWEDHLPNALQKLESMVMFRRLDINAPSPVYSPEITIEGRRLSNPVKAISQPSIAAEGSNVYLIWEGTDTQNPDSEIFFIRSTNGDTAAIGGPTFTSPTATESNISNNGGRSKKGRIAFSGPNLFISWEDTSSGAPLVLLRDSIDSGGTFRPAQTLINSSNTIGNTAITASGTSLFTFWEDALFGNFEIFSSRRELF